MQRERERDVESREQREVEEDEKFDERAGEVERKGKREGKEGKGGRGGLSSAGPERRECGQTLSRHGSCHRVGTTQRRRSGRAHIGGRSSPCKTLGLAYLTAGANSAAGAVQDACEMAPRELYRWPRPDRASAVSGSTGNSRAPCPMSARRRTALQNRRCCGLRLDSSPRTAEASLLA